jgi:hypothetical protein
MSFALSVFIGVDRRQIAFFRQLIASPPLLNVMIVHFFVILGANVL